MPGALPGSGTGNRSTKMFDSLEAAQAGRPDPHPDMNFNIKKAGVPFKFPEKLAAKQTSASAPPVTKGRVPSGKRARKHNVRRG